MIRYSYFMSTNQNHSEEADTRIIRLSGRVIVQKWDGLSWVTVSDKKENK